MSERTAVYNNAGQIVDSVILGPHYQPDDPAPGTTTIESHDQATATDLKPCPFCGAAKTDLDRVALDEVVARCSSCSAYGPTAVSSVAARTAWNKRAAATGPAAIRQMMDEVLDGIQQEWIEQQCDQILSENGRMWPTEEAQIIADVTRRLAPFRTYLSSKVGKLLGEG